MHVKKLLAASIAILVISGCATTSSEEMLNDVVQDMDKTVSSIGAKKPAPGLIKVDAVNEVPGKAYSDIDLNDDSGSVNIRVSGRIGPVLQGYADAIGYGLSWVNGVSKNKTASISLVNVSEKTAIRKITSAAGYVAVFDHAHKMVTIAEEATYVFHMPRHLMREESTDFSMGEDSGGGGGGGGSGGGMGMGMGMGRAGGGGGGSMDSRAKFSSTGKLASPSKSIEAYIQHLVGSKNAVSISPEIGHISVRGNGVVLERVRSYLQQLANQSMRQVKIDVAVIDVGVGQESNIGIDWNKAMRGLGGNMTLGLTTAADVVGQSMQIGYTSASVNSLINALKKNNDLKIVTQPQITATNGVPTMIFDGQEIPYLGSVSSTATDVGVTQSGSVSYASDGVSLSAITDVISDTEAHLTLVPSIMKVNDLNTFDLGDTQLVAPSRTSKEALISTTLRDGQTTVIGGIRYNSKTKSHKVLPFVNVPFGAADSSDAREVAILLHTRIAPEKQYQILFSESL